MRSSCSVSVCRPNYFVFYAVCVVGKESRRLVLPRTSCLFDKSFFTRSIFGACCQNP
jgi:hypothetical protein